MIATPKINFVGGTQLKTTGAKTEEVKTAAAASTTNNTAATPAADGNAEGTMLIYLSGV